MRARDHAAFQRDNPHRTPDWRFARVKALVTHQPNPKRCTVHDEPIIRQARAFLLKLKDAPATEHGDIFADYLDLYYAYTIFEHADVAPEVPFQIETRVLADQPVDLIASRVGIRPATVQIYEELFFDVRPHLAARDWVQRAVLMPALRANPIRSFRNGKSVFDASRPTVEPALDATCKIFAYSGGSIVCDNILSILRSDIVVRGIEDLSNFYDAQWRDVIRRRSAQVAAILEINEYRVMEIMTLHSRVIELEQSAGETQQATKVDQFVAGVLSEFIRTTGGDSQEYLKALGAGDYTDSFTELNPDDMVDLALGRENPRLALMHEAEEVITARFNKKSASTEGQDEHAKDQ